LILKTESAQATVELGVRLGSLLTTGDLVVLIGELGAGKTALTKGVARGLGIKKNVTSPTFVLVKKYQGSDLQLLHVDAYRLNSMGEIDDLGIEAALAAGVVIVEWGTAILPAYQPTVVITISGQDDSRRFDVELFGDTALDRDNSWHMALREFAA